MGIMRLRGLLVLCLAGLLLGGCASKEPADSGPDMEPMEQAPELGAGSDDEASTEPAGPVIEDGKVIIPVDDGMGGEMTEMLNGVFYFDFDQAIVKRSGHGELDKHASVLSGDRYIRVRLEGHADERGTREYNLALGERRADSARDYLVSLGVDPNRVKIVSFGKERPAVPGSNESAWAQNRRAVVVINAN